jgi:hypothetical protein
VERTVVAIGLASLFSDVAHEMATAALRISLTLFGSNVGVELGQLVVVALFLPLAFWARRSPRYRSFVVDGGSIAVALVASVWFVQRLM